MKTRFYAKRMFVLACLSGCFGCANLESDNDELLQSRPAPSEQHGAAAPPALAPGAAAPGAARSKPADWISARLGCGIDHPTLPTIDQVMADVPPRERVKALESAMLEKLDGPGAQALLGLLAEADGAEAIAFMPVVYAKAHDLAAKDLEEKSAQFALPIDVTEKLPGAIQSIRMACLDVAATVQAPSALAFLSNTGLADADDATKLFAARLLAHRPDFKNKEQLSRVRNQLRPDLRELLPVAP